MSQPAGRDTYSHLHQMFLPRVPLPEALAHDPHLSRDLLVLVVLVPGGGGSLTGENMEKGCRPGWVPAQDSDSAHHPYP